MTNYKPTEVCLHAFKEDAEGWTYAEPHEAQGWSVYTRSDNLDDESDFDIDDEMEFATYDEALTEALARAERLNLPLDEY